MFITKIGYIKKFKTGKINQNKINQSKIKCIKGELKMGFVFNFDRFKKNKRKINPFQLVDDFDYDFAESFEMDDYEVNDDFEDFDDVSLYSEEEMD
jgi:hypothetical protein